MKVLLMPSSYPPVLGGLQTVAHQVASHLARMGHDLRVVTNRHPRSLPARDVIDGVTVERWQFLRPSLRQLLGGRIDLLFASLYYSPSVTFRLHRLLRTFRPDVVNVHFPDAQIPFFLGLRRRYGFRLVVSLHGHDVERFTGNEEGAGEKSVQESLGLCALLREADAVTACSGHLLAEASGLEGSVARKGTVIYNGIDPDRFQDKSVHRHGRPYILALGRLTKKKGFDLLLEAFARAGPPVAGVDLILAGEGEERAALELLARNRGLVERVHFFGRASQTEVVRLLNGCLFLAVPSRVEPFGIVALEALAAGKPVLATRVGGMGKFLAELSARPNWPGARHNGKPSDGTVLVRLVDADVESLAAGLGEQIVAPSIDGVQTANAIGEEFAWKGVSEKYARVLSEH